MHLCQGQKSRALDRQNARLRAREATDDCTERRSSALRLQAQDRHPKEAVTPSKLASEGGRAWRLPRLADYQARRHAHESGARAPVASQLDTRWVGARWGRHAPAALLPTPSWCTRAPARLVTRAPALPDITRQGAIYCPLCPPSLPHPSLSPLTDSSLNHCQACSADTSSLTSTPARARVSPRDEARARRGSASTGA